MAGLSCDLLRVTRATLFAVPVLLLAACGGSSPSPSLVPPAPSETVTQAAAPETGPTGASFYDAPLTVTAVSVRSLQAIPDQGDGLGPKPATHGWFVVVNVKVTADPGTAGDTTGSGVFYLQAADGTRYDPTTVAEFGPELDPNTTVTPDSPVKANVVWDSPVQHGRLVYAPHGVPLFIWSV